MKKPNKVKEFEAVVRNAVSSISLADLKKLSRRTLSRKERQYIDAVVGASQGSVDDGSSANDSDDTVLRWCRDRKDGSPIKPWNKAVVRLAL